MKQFKKIDWIVQAALIIMGIAWNLSGLARGRFIGNEPFIIPYFVTGGLQLMSTVVHAVQPAYNKKMPRRIYLFLLAAVLLAGAICVIQGDAILVFFLGLLFAAPVMAIYYCLLRMVETRVIGNSKLIQA